MWQSRNDVQIPNNEHGTRFSLMDLVGDGPWPAGRFYFTWNINERHGLRVLLAPLSYTETGIFDEPVVFAGETYLPGVPTEATYQFNSWRLTYRYQFQRGRPLDLVGRVHRQDPRRQDRAPPGRHREQGHRRGLCSAAPLRGRLAIRRPWHLLLISTPSRAAPAGPGPGAEARLRHQRPLDRHRGLPHRRGRRRPDEVYNFAWFNSAVVSGSRQVLTVRVPSLH